MTYWLGEPLLYLCFAVVFGWLTVIRARETDAVSRMPVTLIQASVIGIGVFSFLPVLRIIMFFAEDAGFVATLKSVLFTTTEGKAYAWTLLFCLMLLFVIKFGAPAHNKQVWPWILCVILCLGLTITVSWTSHMTANYGLPGLFANLVHVLAVMVWSGTLIAAGWFKADGSSWSKFLSWFHILAMIAMVLIMASGWLLTATIAPEYVNSFALPYGQALLIKHLLILPLLIFALMNGVLVKRKLSRDPSFQPFAWARAESFIVLAIYVITGYMNQQHAPLEVSETLRDAPASPLFLRFHQGYQDAALRLQWEPVGMICVIIALGCLAGMLLMFRNNKNAYLSITLGLFFVLMAYLAVMTSIA